MVKKAIKILVFVVLLVLTACKAETIEDGMKQSDIQYVKISHVVPMDAGATVFYRAKSDISGQFPLGVAYFKGSDETGWEHIKHGFSYYENENLMVEMDRIPSHPLFPVQEVGDRKYLTFGEINNPYIQKVLVRDRATGKWNEAKIVREHDFIFYHIGDPHGVKGVSEQGHVIDIQGTGDKEMQDLHKRESIAHDFLHEKVLKDGGNHYYLGTIDEFIVLEDEMKNKENYWKLANIDPKTFEGQTVFIEKYKVDLHQLEQTHRGDAFAYIIMIDNKAFGGYISVEKQGSKLVFDLEQNQISN